LPGARNKTKQDLTRPLSAAALTLLDAQPRTAGVPYVFALNRRPISTVSRCKLQFDAACGVSGWVLHDLRRVSRSLLSRAGVSVDTAERCLGHVIGGVRGTYDRHRYEAEMLDAYEALSRLLARIVDPPAGNVVTLRA
jgi:integrase